MSDSVFYVIEYISRRADEAWIAESLVVEGEENLLAELREMVPKVTRFDLVIKRIYVE